MDEVMCDHSHYPAPAAEAVGPCPDNDDLRCCRECHGDD